MLLAAVEENARAAVFHVLGHRADTAGDVRHTRPHRVRKLDLRRRGRSRRRVRWGSAAAAFTEPAATDLSGATRLGPICRRRGALPLAALRKDHA